MPESMRNFIRALLLTCMRTYVPTFALLACFLFPACDGGSRVAGGGSDIGNGSAITGLAFTTDGLPARGAMARLRPLGYLSPAPALALKSGSSPTAADSLADTRSDSKGHFTFAHIRPGRYRIEIADTAHAQAALIECNLDSGGQDVELGETRLTATGTLTLKAPAGAASGAIGYVRLTGLERLARLDAGDSLRITDLPAGSYTVDVASRDPAFAALSGSPVSLHPGETTLLDSAALPCGDRACDSLVLDGFLKANHIDSAPSAFTVDPGRILNLRFYNLPSSFRFSTVKGLGRLTALATFKVEAPYLTDSLMDPLMRELARPDSLWMLNLSWSLDSGFTAIPPSIGKLTRLRELYLLGDSLRTLPGEIGELRNLVFLSLQFNRLNELPDWGGLTALKELQVPHNKLKVLPESVFSWPALEKIDIADNHLCSFTDAQKAWLQARNAYPGPEGQTCP
jgi:hypothetical protein